MTSREWYQQFEGQVKDWDLEQCKDAWEIIKGQYDFLQRREAGKQLARFHRGQRVEFTSRKRGIVVQGTIERINAKTVSLKDCSDGNVFGWKVHFSLLRPVAETATK